MLRLSYTAQINNFSVAAAALQKVTEDMILYLPIDFHTVKLNGVRQLISIE